MNGIQVALEENYMFDYNITKLSMAMKKALNRERSNVGRVAYTETVKKLLLKSSSEAIIQRLIYELKNYNMGGSYDEISYVDIQVHAMKTYNTRKPVMFVSQEKAYQLTNDDKEKIKDSGRELIIVPQNAFDKIEYSKDNNGNAMGTFELVQKEYNDAFEYVWVSPDDLSLNRKDVWGKHNIVMDWLGDTNWRYQIRISKTINEYVSGDTQGVYDPTENAIIIKENILDNEAVFFDVLIHEYIHATTGYFDNSRDFENELGKIIGRMGAELFNQQNEHEKIKIEKKIGIGKVLGLFKTRK